jgi:hypothetical protein
MRHINQYNYIKVTFILSSLSSSLGLKLLENIFGWRRGSSGTTLPSKLKALSSNPIPQKTKKENTFLGLE